jgi:hypothetical protein
VYRSRWRSWGAAVALVAGWYLLAWIVVRPLSDAPVVDSWLYQHAVEALWRTGHLQFAGFAQAEPAGQVVYGVLWSRLFGATSASFDVSVALLGAMGALALYALARRCGARHTPALLATGLLICNPCYLFLSFSFMSEVPFLLLLLASHLAFACADGSRPRLFLWLTAMLAVVAFTVRPFGGAAIIGTAGALLLYDRELWRGAPEALARTARSIAPLVVGFVACAAFWMWLVRELPWYVTENESRIRSYFFLVPALRYFKAWLLAPAFCLGFVLAPLALMHTVRRWRIALPITFAIFAVAMLVTAIDDRMVWRIPECKCFGGWPGALVLRGMPGNFGWHKLDGWIAAALASAGAVGLCVAAAEVIPRMGRAAAAVMLTAALYWAAMLPLWFFSDRYDLVLVPAGCLLLALAPLPHGRSQALAAIGMAAAIIMTAAMGLMSLGGLDAYQRGAEAVLQARDALLAKRVPRAAIDAGYALNGQDLYRYPPSAMDTHADELGIPMVTSDALFPYTIAAAPLVGTEEMRRFSWPGPFGFGARPLYVLRFIPPGTHTDTLLLPSSPANNADEGAGTGARHATR